MFNVDKVTNEAIIAFDGHLEGEESKTKEKHGDGKLRYVRYYTNYLNLCMNNNK